MAWWFKWEAIHNKYVAKPQDLQHYSSWSYNKFFRSFTRSCPNGKNLPRFENLRGQEIEISSQQNHQEFRDPFERTTRWFAVICGSNQAIRSRPLWRGGHGIGTLGPWYVHITVCCGFAKLAQHAPHFTKGATFKKVILIATTYYPSENGFTSSTDKNSLVTFCEFVNLIFAYLFSHHSHLLLLWEPETIKRFHFFLLSFFSDDWTPEPEFIATLRKPALRNLAKRIARLWRDLSRKIKEDVKDNSSLYSIIYVPNGFVVPGGECLQPPL